MKREVDGKIIECVEGDITNQPEFDAVVNAANAQLRTGGGVAGAIHRAAGPELYEECKPLAPINTTEAVITSAPNMSNEYIIHALGPVYSSSSDPEEELAKTYRNSLDVAEENGARSVAFPAISTGAFGYPLREAAKIAIKAVVDYISKLDSVEHVRFVLFDQSSAEVHKQVLDDAMA